MSKGFDKYKFYEASVQDPHFEIEILNEKFKEIRGKKPLSLREDFGGTGWLACEWAKQGNKHSSIAIDLDPEPIEYGLKKHYAKLSGSQKKRVKYLQKDVMKCSNEKADIVCAFNFSFWFFKERKKLLKYFKAVRKSMKSDSIFVFDTKGGQDALDTHLERREHPGFTYYWECEEFNPISGEGQFAIHFKPKGQHRIERRVFTYDWRCWSLPEIKDILAEAGFSESHVYWEGTNDDDDDEDDGNGIFTRTEKTEEELVWISYVIALP